MRDGGHGMADAALPCIAAPYSPIPATAPPAAQYVELFGRIRSELLRAGHVRTPHVYVHPSNGAAVPRLQEVVRGLKADVAQSEGSSGVTHVVHPLPPGTEPDDSQRHARMLEVRWGVGRQPLATSCAAVGRARCRGPAPTWATVAAASGLPDGAARQLTGPPFERQAGLRPIDAGARRAHPHPLAAQARQLRRMGANVGHHRRGGPAAAPAGRAVARQRALAAGQREVQRVDEPSRLRDARGGGGGQAQAGRWGGGPGAQGAAGQLLRRPPVAWQRGRGSGFGQLGNAWGSHEQGCVGLPRRPCHAACCWPCFCPHSPPCPARDLCRPRPPACLAR